MTGNDDDHKVDQLDQGHYFYFYFTNILAGIIYHCFLILSIISSQQ